MIRLTTARVAQLVASAKPNALALRLGAFDARAQRIVTSEPVSTSRAGRQIANDWPALRSALVQAGAGRTY